MSVCLSVRFLSQKLRVQTIFLYNMLTVAVAQSSSKYRVIHSFVDDVTFSHNGVYGPESKDNVMFSFSSSPVGHQTTLYSSGGHTV